jgi:hypothetical protein
MTTNNNEQDGVPSCLFTSNILTEKEPIGIIQMINQGMISRFEAWQVLQLVHQEELKCGLPQYGVLTVFSLSNDVKQFQQLFDQGCNMLRDEGIIDDEFEKATFEALSKIISKQKKMNVISTLDKKPKTGKLKKSKKNSSTKKNN